jgi:bifunctional non-homologous end joining protein LigD
VSDEVTVVDVGGRPVRLTSLDKVIYPRTGTTKAEVLDYVARVSAALLPHVRDRPVTRIRWPHGVEGPSFFEKNAPAGRPSWVRTLDVPASDGAITFPFADDVATLVWMANLSALELHVPQWTVGRRGAVRPPDRLVIDLDPGPPAGLAECAQVAALVAERLADDGLEPLPVTSGSKGLQLYAAVSGRQDAAVLREYARTLAEGLARDHRALVVSRMTKALRPGKVLLDWSQNTAAKTTIAPYSLRGRERPTVAAPRSWDEMGPDLAQLTAAEVLARLDADGDLLEPLLDTGPRVPEP